MRAPRTASPFISFDSLESRRLMATINVTTYGAKPNDGADDSATIQRAINAAGAGDTVYFPAGTYNVSKIVTISSNKNLTGDGATSIIQGQSSEGQVFNITGDSDSVTKLAFNGGGIDIDRSSGYNTNIVIDHVDFELHATGINPSAITFHSGLASSVISNNYFTGYTGGYAIYGYNYSGLTIHNNEVVNTTAGFHIDAFGNSGDLLVQANYETGVKNMGFEFQGKADGDQFLDNWYENPVLSSTFSANNNSQAFSLILDQSSNITVSRNVVIAPQRPDGVGTRIGFELGGDNSQAYDNYINGINQVASDNDGTGSSSVTFHDNFMDNYLEAPGQAFPAANRTWSAYNNGPNVKLTWDISRGHPGIDGVYGESDLPTLPVDNPIPVNTKAPTNLAVRQQSGTSALLTWADHDNDILGYYVEISANGGAWNTLTLTSGKAVSYLATGLKSGNTYSFRVRGFNAAGYSAYTNIATLKIGASSTGGTGTTGTTTTTGSGGGTTTTGGGTSGGGKTTITVSSLVLRG